MTIKITNTTDHKFIGDIINYDGLLDNLYLGESRIELISSEITDLNIKLISANYIVEGDIIEE